MALHTPEERQLFAFERRPQLLALARRHAASTADAEDAVSMAIERARRADIADPPRLYCWLSSVTINATRELRRPRLSTRTLARWQAGQPENAEDPAEQVCDRAEAEWAAEVVAKLSEHQRDAIRLVASGRSVHQIAEHLAISSKAAESLLRRARIAVRAALVASWTFVGGLAVTIRRCRVSRPAVAAGSLLLVGIVVSARPLPPVTATPPTAPGVTRVRASEPLPDGDDVVRSSASEPASPRLAHVPAMTDLKGPATPRLPDAGRALGSARWFVYVRDDSRADRTGKPLAEDVVDCVHGGPVAGTERLGCVADS